MNIIAKINKLFSRPKVEKTPKVIIPTEAPLDETQQKILDKLLNKIANSDVTFNYESGFGNYSVGTKEDDISILFFTTGYYGSLERPRNVVELKHSGWTIFKGGNNTFDKVRTAVDNRLAKLQDIAKTEALKQFLNLDQEKTDE